MAPGWGRAGPLGRGREVATRTARHPFAAEGGPLREGWRELGGGSEGDLPADVRLLLPTAEGRPLPSPDRARMGEETTPRDATEVTLAEWLAPAITVPPLATLRWLAQLPREKHPAPHLHFGAD